MASLRDIRKRIRSVRNSQKITKAMKLVAASKLRRAQDAMLAARPYAVEVASLLGRLSARSAAEGSSDAVHPMLEVRTPRKVLLVVLTSDRGLCGAFNASVLRRAERFIREHGERFESLEIATIGKKGRDYFRKRNVATVRDFPGVFENLNYRRATEIAQGITDEYLARDLDAVYVVYTEFKSAISQKVQVHDLLPVVSEELPMGDAIDYVYEPDQTQVLDTLAPRYVATLIWRALLESAASEYGARMTAMDSASNNARDLIERLSLKYNRARQAAITIELMDIVGGAEALNG